MASEKKNNVDAIAAPSPQPATPGTVEDAEATKNAYGQLDVAADFLHTHAGEFGDITEDELWNVVAGELADAGTPTATALTREPTLPAKANLASRLDGRGEDPDYVEIVNPIRECAVWSR